MQSHRHLKRRRPTFFRLEPERSQFHAFDAAGVGFDAGDQFFVSRLLVTGEISRVRSEAPQTLPDLVDPELADTHLTLAVRGSQQSVLWKLANLRRCRGLKTGRFFRRAASVIDIGNQHLSSRLLPRDRAIPTSDFLASRL